MTGRNNSGGVGSDYDDKVKRAMVVVVVGVMEG